MDLDRCTSLFDASAASPVSGMNPDASVVARLALPIRRLR
jgi:hypothetical protein